MLTCRCDDRARATSPTAWIPSVFALIASAGAAAAESSLAQPSVERWRVGMAVQATGACTGILATVPVPMDWPEQSVRELEQQVTPAVSPLRYRTLDGGAKQLLIAIERLNAGQTATVLVTLEITRQRLPAPGAPGELRAPASPSRELRAYLGSSPSIETRHPRIQQLANEITAAAPHDWARVEAIYDGVRQRVRYEFDVQLRGALAALDSGHGDCEELTSLFVALCRVQGIPARSVWVPGHCYPEFYLEDATGTGRWYPCQAAGSREFGEITESRPILQKGDSFRIPGERNEQRYVAETFRARHAATDPQVRFVCEKLSDEPTAKRSVFP